VSDQKRSLPILEALQRNGVLRISDLTDTLGAAAVTIRRDIAQLAAEGLVRRVHGGVALLAPEDAPVPEDAAPGAGTALGTGSLGMLVPSLDYYWPDVARGAEEAARELDMRVVLRGSSYESEDDRPQLTRLVDQLSVDGLIVAPRNGRAYHRQHPAVADDARHSGRPDGTHGHRRPTARRARVGRDRPRDGCRTG
jgi:DNA-binding Lrp family transcriptional regulator